MDLNLNNRNRNFSIPNADKLAKVALTAFFNIAKFWNLRTEDEYVLLGKPVRSTFF